MTQHKDELLRSYLQKISRSDGLEAFIEAPAVVAADGAGPEAGGVPLAGIDVMKKLAEGKPLTPLQQYNLEAIIIPDKRPAIDIVDGDFHVRHSLWQHWNEDKIKNPLRQSLHSIGRLELPGHPSYPYGGSGFVVGEGLLMTNRHVAEIFSNGLGLRGLRFITGVEAGIDFLRERDRTATRYLQVTGVVMIHPYWDMALLRVEGLGIEQRPLQLVAQDLGDWVGKEVAVIGYPAFDPRNPAQVQNEVFDGVYGVKRLMPGFLSDRVEVESYRRQVSSAAHDSSTLPGASGSAVLDPLTGRVLGLHFAGAYLQSNYAVPAFELSRDSRVVDAGVSFHGSTGQGPAPWNDVWQGHEKPDTLDVAPPPTVQAPVQAGSVHTFTIPLQISVALGGNTGGNGVVVSTVPASPLPAVAVAAPVHDQEPLLSLLVRSQKAGGSGTQRFVLNFHGTPDRDDAQLVRQIESTLGLQSRIMPLFEDDPELNRHRLLELSAVPALERDDVFELARLLRDAAQAETCDPDLGSDYFADDGFDRAGPEGVDLTFWCWAGDDQLPEDPDWAIELTNTPQAWAYSKARGKPSRGQDILVFQPDTGVVPSHPELPKNIVNHPLALNLLEPGKPPIDPMTGGGNPGHGTGTGSVVASPEVGRMRGAAPLATLVPIRCLETVAVFNQSNVARAIDHARRSGAHVITMSLGGVFSDALHTALRKAVQANIIVVAAAGNCVPSVVWPARYEEAIAVGGINEQFKPWRGSSHGSAVDISGPAEFVRRASARDPNDVGAVSGGQGTSFATAHLAGVAALWLAHHGRDQLLKGLASGVTLQQVFRALVQSSARKSGHLDEDEYGAGIVDASGLLKLDPAKAFGLEAVYRAPVHDIRQQVAELLVEAAGTGALEAAAAATGDPQNLGELACIALDQLRLARGRRVQVESLPPQAMSAGLRRILGERAQVLYRGGDDV